MTPLEAVRSLIEAERLGAVATVVEGPDAGAKAVLDRTEGLAAGALPEDVAEAVAADAARLMDREQNRTLAYGGRRIYIETVAPQPLLLIFGASSPKNTSSTHSGRERKRFRAPWSPSRPAISRGHSQRSSSTGWPRRNR